jgi:hypothetical protein
MPTGASATEFYETECIIPYQVCQLSTICIPTKLKLNSLYEYQF